MRRKAVFIIAMIQLAYGSFMYIKGKSDGVRFYKSSKQFRMTLLSMYRYGLQDGCDHPSWCK